MTSKVPAAHRPSSKFVRYSVKSSTPPGTPSGGSWNGTTFVVANDWGISVPGGMDQLWVSLATLSGVGNTVTYSAPIPVGGSSFSPTQANIYNAVKDILHPDDQTTVTADDANNELDITFDPNDAGDSLGEIWAETNALATAGLPTSDYFSTAQATWTLSSDAPTGAAIETDNYPTGSSSLSSTLSSGVSLPVLNPDGVIGIWAECVVDGTVVSRTFLAWGPGGSAFVAGFDDERRSRISSILAASATQNLTIMWLPDESVADADADILSHVVSRLRAGFVARQHHRSNKSGVSGRPCGFDEPDRRLRRASAHQGEQHAVRIVAKPATCGRRELPMGR